LYKFHDCIVFQGPKITYNYCLSRRLWIYCDVLRWASVILNAIIRRSGKYDNFIFHSNVSNLILLFTSPSYATWYPCFFKTIRKMCIFYLLLEINGIKLNISWKIEEEWFCFTPNANFHFTEKQELINLSNSQVQSWNSLFLLTSN